MTRQKKGKKALTSGKGKKGGIIHTKAVDIRLHDAEEHERKETPIIRRKKKGRRSSMRALGLRGLQPALFLN